MKSGPQSKRLPHRLDSRIDQRADLGEYVADGVAQLRHRRHGCQGHHAGREGIFDQILRPGVFPNAIDKIFHVYLLGNLCSETISVIESTLSAGEGELEKGLKGGTYFAGYFCGSEPGSTKTVTTRGPRGAGYVEGCCLR